MQTTGTVATSSPLDCSGRCSTRILTITGVAGKLTVLLEAARLRVLRPRDPPSTRPAGLRGADTEIVGSLCGCGVYVGLSGLGVGPVSSYDDFSHATSDLSDRHGG